jgi:hypothetical protein
MSDNRAAASPLLACLLVGCASATPPAVTGGGISSNGVVVREDLSERFLALIGPRAQHDPPYLGAPDTNYSCLRSFVDRKNGETAHQLYVAASYDAKRDWSAAHDAAGQNLTFLPISRYQIACGPGGICSYSEEFAAKFSESELRQNPRGFSVTFTEAGGGAQTIAVSARQVSAQLAALAELQEAPRGAQTAVPTH